MEFSLFQLIATGGDLAILAVLFLLWRVDRRLVRVETIVINGKTDHND